jgi:TRAP-type C4-dicarboxylate transport system permease large subunit
VLFRSFWAWRHPDRVPEDGEPVPLAERLRRLRLLAPVTVLIIAVIGSIYAGIATATEAAAVGVLGALVIAGVGGSLSRASLVASLMGAVRTSCMIGFILMGAAFLTSAMSFTGLPATVAAWITGLGLAPWQLLTVLTAFFVLLGCFLDGISIGSLAGAGTLGLLIPPSIIMIVYGVSADVSISKLFMAGVLPGVMLAGLFSGWLVLWALRHPELVPQADARLSFGQKLRESRHLIPVVLLIVAVLGSIYSGIATATEAAAVGVLGSLVLSAAQGSLDRKSTRLNSSHNPASRMPSSA